MLKTEQPMKFSNELRRNIEERQNRNGKNGKTDTFRCKMSACNSKSVYQFFFFFFWEKVKHSQTG